MYIFYKIYIFLKNNVSIDLIERKYNKITIKFNIIRFKCILWKFEHMLQKINYHDEKSYSKFKYNNLHNLYAYIILFRINIYIIILYNNCSLQTL